MDSTVLCLCPNDHARFDFGVVVIEDDRTVIVRADGTALGALLVDPRHVLDEQYLAYHRDRFDLTE